jgi:hypothetical protein
MPKLSFADEIYEMERAVAAARHSARWLPALAAVKADELAALIARLRETKAQQRAEKAAGMEATRMLEECVEEGERAARMLRACAILTFGTRSPRLAQFGIHIRRKPRRRAGAAAASATEAPARLRSRTVQTARASVAGTRALAPANGGDGPGIGGMKAAAGATAAAVGGPATPKRGTAAAVGGTAASNRAATAAGRAPAAGNRATRLRLRGLAAANRAAAPAKGANVGGRRGIVARRTRSPRAASRSMVKRS